MASGLETVDSIARRVAALDVSLFAANPPQAATEDIASLLALHVAAREAYGTIDYLEVGSHLGGSLQALIRDPACRSIVSIDSRPASQPDARGRRAQYPENTTARMIRNLQRLPDADLSKLTTFDTTTAGVDRTRLPFAPNVCFVDAEHTAGAALADARFCRDVLQAEGCIAFHDAQLVYRGIDAFLRELDCEHRSYFLPVSVFVVEIGRERLIASRQFHAAVIGNASGYLWGQLHNDHFRELYLRTLHFRVRELKHRLLGD